MNNFQSIFCTLFCLGSVIGIRVLKSDLNPEKFENLILNWIQARTLDPNGSGSEALASTTLVFG